MKAPELDRPNLSAAATDAIRARIVDGRLPEGGRINEVHLSTELGVSRTPLREALARLVAEGALLSVPRSGVFVRPLSAEEVEELYPIRAVLDPEALRMAGLPSRSDIEALRMLNRKIQAASDPAEVVELDDEWHLRLLAGCSNRLLLELINQFIWRTRRYELGLMREQDNVVRAGGDHDRILDALQAGDLAQACAGLKANMQSGKQPILDWLARRRR